MEWVISDGIYRKLLMFELIEGEQSTLHDLFPNHNFYNYLFVGPKASGRTSLLFEYAFQAAEHSINVLYITQKHIEKLPHFFQPRDQPCMDVLKLIEILYIDSVGELLTCMAKIHMGEKKYGLVIIDGLDDFYLPFDKESLRICAKICAFVCDAVSYLRSHGCDTMFICSVVSSMNAQHQTIRKVMENWIPNTLYFYPHHRGSGFIIKSHTNVAIGNSDDVDVKSVHLEFRDDKIYMP